MANEVEADFELRADHVAEATLRDGTAKTDFFDAVQSSLLSKRLTLIVGPRGCGKTHMMRYAWLRCADDPGRPLAIYVSFNRYLRLEPLLKTHSDALQLFQSWILARILLALDDVATRIGGKDFPSPLGERVRVLSSVVSRLERGIALSAEDLTQAEELSIDDTVATIARCCLELNRKRVVLLLDDAALTLTPEFLVEFFDVVRALKRGNVAPKCSVYPGTTQYGPRFHVREEAQVVRVWLPVTDPNYLKVMGTIGALRHPEAVSAVSDEVNQFLMYAAFGVPRAYLSLLHEATGNGSPNQATLNRVVRELRDAQIVLYETLEQKIPRLASVVATGAKFFAEVVKLLQAANEGLYDGGEKQLLLGVEAADFEAMTSRMVNLLVEAGLLFEHEEVKHGGPERRYRRFTPHLSALMAVRAFSGRQRGESPKAVVAFVQRKPSKHPVRRRLATLLPGRILAELKLDLPPCQNCGEPRKEESSLFCHRCGNRLIDPSSFGLLMQLPISQVPNLSVWLRDRVAANGVKTIRDLLSFQDPGSELRKIHRVGPVRAESVVNAVEAYVDEFLS